MNSRDILRFYGDCLSLDGQAITAKWKLTIVNGSKDMVFRIKESDNENIERSRGHKVKAYAPYEKSTIEAIGFIIDKEPCLLGGEWHTRITLALNDLVISSGMRIDDGRH